MEASIAIEFEMEQVNNPELGIGVAGSGSVDVEIVNGKSTDTTLELETEIETKTDSVREALGNDEGGAVPMEEAIPASVNVGEKIDDICEGNADIIAAQGLLLSPSNTVSIMKYVTSENDKLRAENVQLRNVLLALCDRLTALEEFNDVELGGERFSKFLQNRERLINVMGVEQTSGDMLDGKRSAKSSELVGLLKLVKAQAKPNGPGASGTTPSAVAASSSDKSSTSQPKLQKLSTPGAKGGPPPKQSSGNQISTSASADNPPPRQRRPRHRRGGQRLRAKIKNSCKICYLIDHPGPICPYRDETKISWSVRLQIDERKHEYDKMVKLWNKRQRQHKKPELYITKNR